MKSQMTYLRVKYYSDGVTIERFYFGKFHQTSLQLIELQHEELPSFEFTFSSDQFIDVDRARYIKLYE